MKLSRFNTARLTVTKERPENSAENHDPDYDADPEDQHV